MKKLLTEHTTLPYFCALRASLDDGLEEFLRHFGLSRAPGYTPRSDESH
jgi:hypothetical protein